MKNLLYLLSILSLSHFTLSLHAQEALEEDDTPHTSEAETESIAQKEIPITWKRFAVREAIYYIAYGIIAFLFLSLVGNQPFDPYGYFTFIGFKIIPHIVSLILYAQKLSWTQSISYRYGSDIFTHAMIALFIELLDMGDRSFEFSGVLLLFLIMDIPSLLCRSIIDLIDHFVVSRSIPYATAEDQEIQESKKSTI